MRANVSSLKMLVLLSSLILLAGCDNSFQPLEKNDKYFFTIFGYLDVAADAQWIRIEPPRTQVIAPPEVQDIEVTLENIETGTIIVMKDSLFGADSEFSYINFYTTAGIESNQTYRVEAKHADGRSSWGILTTPKEFPTPLFIMDSSYVPRELHHSVIIKDVEKLIDVQTWYFVRNNSTNKIRKFVFSYRNSTKYYDSAYGGAYIADVIPNREEKEIFLTLSIPTFFNSGYTLLRKQIFVASGGSEWNKEIPEMSDLVYAQMESFSNIEKGLGYVVGVYSKVIPYATCKNENESDVAPCEVEKPYR